MKKPVIYLHIGMNKTGTTAVQHFLKQNRETLIKYGVLYPEAGLAGAAHYKYTRVLDFERKKQSNVDNSFDKQSLRKNLDREIVAYNPDYVIISSEDFVRPREVLPVYEFFAPYEVKIVVYLRRHDAWWESSYRQAVKAVVSPPWGSGIDSFMTYTRTRRRAIGDYRGLLDRWARVFGKENVIVRPYEIQQNQPHIVSDLFHSLGLSNITDKVGSNPQRFNEALTVESIALMDIYQRLDIDVNLRKKLLAHAATLGTSQERMSLLSPAKRRALVDEYADDYSYIAREYLGRENGILFLDPLPDPDEPWAAPEPMSCLRIAEETIKALI